MLFAGSKVCIVKTVAKHFQDFAHSNLLYGPTLGWLVTYLFFSSLAQVNVLILSLPPAQTLHALQMQ